MRLWLIALITTFSMVALAVDATEAETPILSETKAEAKTEAKTEAKAEVKADTRQESEINLNLEAGKKASSGDSTVFRILFSISMVGILGGGAFIFLRKYATPKAMKNQTQIKVLQQHYLGPKKSLAIVRVAGESILIGITDNNINMIKSLSLLDDEVPEETPEQFSKMLNKSQANEPKEDGEDFSFGGIKDIVSKRLRGMRDLE